MTRLAMRSLAARRTAFAACSLTVLLGSALILSFLGLITSASADGVSSTDADTLHTLAGVVGGWGVIIVVFSVASTLGLAVRARSEEFALLRTIGVTRRQIRRMVLREALVVAALASLAGVPPGWLLGRGVVALIRRAGLVAPSVEHRIGVAPAAVTVIGIVVASSIGASLAARRATRGTSAGSLLESRTGRTGTGPGRMLLGAVFLAVGATYSTLVVTVAGHSSDPFAAMMYAGPASIFWSLGFAVLPAPLLQATAAVSAALFSGSRVSGYLALHNARRRSPQLGGALAPVIVLVGVATGTFTMMAIDSTKVAGTTDGEAVELLNFVVVGMISLFAAITVVTTLVATVTDRRGEFADQRLIGVTGAEVMITVGYEGAIIALAGVVFGGLASLGTIVPYAVVKTDGWLPADPYLFLGIAAAVVVGTILTSVTVARRVVAGPLLASV